MKIWQEDDQTRIVDMTEQKKNIEVMAKQENINKSWQNKTIS